MQLGMSLSSSLWQNDLCWNRTCALPGELVLICHPKTLPCVTKCQSGC